MAEALVKVVINRDFWVKSDKEGEPAIRHRKGREIEVPVAAALEGIETGALSRVKAKEAKAEAKAR